ncbi:hypothetical protein V1L52_02310 [Treponema sp. HNW]|uniref:hypothetical protein n=1 Tax=unclassified Treponema TaxID=2638727 RepID=UPI003D0D7A97
MQTGKTLTLERIAEIKSRKIDLSDIPEITEEQWETGYLKNRKDNKNTASGEYKKKYVYDRNRI